MENQASRSVLVVEDNELIREFIVEGLRQASFLVTEAADGLLAISVMKGANTPYLALITDLDMPYMNGIELIQEIEKGPIRFNAYLLITAHLANFTPVEMLLSTPMKTPLYYFPKPFKVEDLAQLLNSIHKKL